MPSLAFLTTRWVAMVRETRFAVLPQLTLAGKWGEVVAALVVPAPHASVDIEALRTHCAQHLSAYKIPRSFVVRSRAPCQVLSS